MADNIIHLDVLTTLDIPPERVLSGAIEADLDTVVVIGWTRDDEFWASASTSDVADLLLLLEMLKKELLRG